MQKARPRTLSDNDIAFIMEQHSLSKTEGRVLNFWWAMGEVYGIPAKLLQQQILRAKEGGMRGASK